MELRRRVVGVGVGVWLCGREETNAAPLVWVALTAVAAAGAVDLEAPGMLAEME